ASHLSQWWMRVAEGIDRRIGWDKLPPALGLPVLVGLRDRLRQENLFDTGVPEIGGLPPSQWAYRTPDGTWNDRVHQMMGAAGTRFGRNVAPADHAPESEPALRTPNPRTVSRTLLTRDQFIPATTLNMLAGAWLQFQVHDWFSHGKNETTEPFTFAVEPGDPWPGQSVIIERTRQGDASGVFRNESTHWWDASQVYGSSLLQQQLLRDGERLKVELGTVPLALTDHLDFTGEHAGFWTGFAAMHTLFALEHNAICEHLRKVDRRAWGEEELFQTARLINIALMAKIHTTEWTPAIIAHPTSQAAMRIDWWGISERLKRSIGRVSAREEISGIPGSPADHHGSPYCLTEEFVAAYRMHPLIPDDFVFRALTTGTERRPMSLLEMRTRKAIPILRELGMPTVLYTFGTAHPGAVTLHNFPRALQEFDREGKLFDLGATDILRNRERGVPRYNRFREAFHKPPVRRFDQLSTNPAWAEEIRRVYDGDIDAVDAMIGFFAEPLPRGFGFSDTAFRVFILMATRRLKSDRFFTDDYNAEHYTEAGLRWIDDNSMKTVLLRHFPELAPALGPLENAFAPWVRVVD
ncbi:MAG: peroxidase family protein, partial [Pseudonocardiaceae bacterium]